VGATVAGQSDAAKQSFEDVRSQTEFGNEENEEKANGEDI
jgi:hypothetical protein